MDIWGKGKVAVNSGKDSDPFFPGISRLTYLPSQISESYTSRNYNGYPWTMDIPRCCVWLFLD